MLVIKISEKTDGSLRVDQNPPVVLCCAVQQLYCVVMRGN